MSQVVLLSMPTLTSVAGILFFFKTAKLHVSIPGIFNASCLMHSFDFGPYPCQARFSTHDLSLLHFTRERETVCQQTALPEFGCRTAGVDSTNQYAGPGM